MNEAGARAFVPGHITGFFSPALAPDPAVAGSRGAGLALSDGVTITVRPADEIRVQLNGTETSIEAADRVLTALDAPALVEVETTLPVGAGFGVSGAVSLGTALAATAALSTVEPRSENDLVTIAHRAEVEAGTGLGDVVAQARGGVPIRLEAGAPGNGRLDGIPAATRVEYVTYGEVSTPDVLRGDTSRIEAAGDRALARLTARPTLETFMGCSRDFTVETGLVTDRVREAIEAVDAAGGTASMAMLGETVFALGTGLSDAGYDPTTCSIHPPGATLDGRSRRRS